MPAAKGSAAACISPVEESSHESLKSRFHARDRAQRFAGQRVDEIGAAPRGHAPTRCLRTAHEAAARVLARAAAGMFFSTAAVSAGKSSFFRIITRSGTHRDIRARRGKLLGGHRRGVAVELRRALELFARCKIDPAFDREQRAAAR